ncbi:MAG: ABC transporter permease [Oscillospiraceae bacterium]|jgi:ribose/xylose/arabinose/galactoside ABC-type transport system permease subunit|nr:ABC transporter permease [Oscillospiraceae bacterium]
MKTESKAKKFFGSKLFTLLLLLAAMVIVFQILSGGLTQMKSSFLDPNNLKQVVAGMSVVSVLTIGAGCLLISGQVDLSAGGIGTLSALLFAHFYTNWGIPLIIALIISLIIAGAIGYFNAVLINKLNCQGFITTMATALVCTGLTYVIAAGKDGVLKNIRIENEAFNYIGTKSILGGYVPIIVLIALAFFIVYGIIVSQTKFGRNIYLVGGNPTASYLAGINPKRISNILFINSAVLGGVAGIFYSAKMKSGSYAGIAGNQFAGMTAAILGGISFGGGSGGMAGAFIGLLILNAFQNGVTIIGVPSYWQQVASGLLLIVALSVDFLAMQRKAAGLRRTVRLGRAEKAAAEEGGNK